MASAGGAIATEADAVDAAGGSRAAPTQLDAMLVTGTRASNRTQFETLAPVDVFSKEDIRSVESTDLKDVLAQLVPSFVVQRLPMADGQVFVRPATLRGLSLTLQSPAIVAVLGFVRPPKPHPKPAATNGMTKEGTAR